MTASSWPAYVLTDFGSTFTKVALVDSQTGALLARGHAPTTVATDVMDGYGLALDRAIAAARGPVSLGPRISASSAGGGLRVAAVGLVADLTAAAALRAALNAGGRVDLVLSGSLAVRDIEALREAKPDVVLFCGGTDGGQRERVLRTPMPWPHRARLPMSSSPAIETWPTRSRTASIAPASARTRSPTRCRAWASSTSALPGRRS